MNRALLLIICDFLLISLLALARFDDEEPPPPPEEVLEESAGVERDLVEILEMALDAEEDARELTEEELAERERQLAEREEAIRERDQSLEERAAELAALEAQRQQLTEERAALETEVAETQATLELTAAERAALDASLAEAQARMSAVQRELAEREEALTTAEAEAAALSQERERLTVDLATRAVALEAAETRLLERDEQISALRTDLEIVRTERERMLIQAERLTAGVTELAARNEEIIESTEDIQEEIRSNQPLTINTIFNRFAENRIEVTFAARVRGFGGGLQTRSTLPVRAVFVADGNEVAALVPLRDTPFNVSGSVPRLEELSGTIAVGPSIYAITEINFLAVDPRVISVRASRADLEANGVEAFPIAANPFQFPEAVLVSNVEDRFGDLSFRIASADTDTRLIVDNRISTRLFGEFSPQRSDLIFVKSGQFLGIMLTDEQAVRVDSLEASVTLPIGEAFEAERTREVLTALRDAGAGR